MAKRGNYDKEAVLADWRTGAFTVRALGSKYKISTATAGQIVKGVEKSIAPLIDKQVDINQALALLTGQEVDSFRREVDEKTKHILFFNSAAVQNVHEAMKAPCDNQRDFKDRAETIIKGKEVALGKQPDTAIQINNQSRIIRIAPLADDDGNI